MNNSFPKIEIRFCSKKITFQYLTIDLDIKEHIRGLIQLIILITNIQSEATMVLNAVCTINKCCHALASRTSVIWGRKSAAWLAVKFGILWKKY